VICSTTGGIIAVGQAPAAVDFAAPDIVGNTGENAAELGVHFLQLGADFTVFPNVAGAHQAERLGFHVKPGHGQIHRNPNFIFAVAKQESFLRLKGAGFLESGPQPLQSSLVLRAKQIGNLLAEQLASGEAAQALHHGIGFVDCFRVRIEQKQRVPRLLEQGHRQLAAMKQIHGAISRSHVNSSTASIQTLPTPP
jgi:hypothetical protein